MATLALCANSCLTQAVVLNAPTEENLDDLRKMCSNIIIEVYPFIEAMLFANLVVNDNGKVVAPGTSATVPLESDSESGSDRVGKRVGIELVVAISLLNVLVSYWFLYGLDSIP